MASTYIYGLQDPRDGMIYYVGKADRPKKRLFEHVADKDTNRFKREWIQDLLSDGYRPVLVILEEVAADAWSDAEIAWIKRGQDEGWPLTNISAGGSWRSPGIIRRDWAKDIKNFLPSAEFALFLTLTEKDQASVCQQAAMAGMQDSWLAIKQRGGDPKTEYDQNRQFLAASLVACNSMYAVVGLV